MLQYDPSAPALISAPYIGDEVLAKLRRPFWSELFSRWGNLFFIRDVRLPSLLKQRPYASLCQQDPESESAPVDAAVQHVQPHSAPVTVM